MKILKALTFAMANAAMNKNATVVDLVSTSEDTMSCSSENAPIQARRPEPIMHSPDGNPKTGGIPQEQLTESVPSLMPTPSGSRPRSSSVQGLTSARTISSSRSITRSVSESTTTNSTMPALETVDNGDEMTIVSDSDLSEVPQGRYRPCLDYSFVKANLPQITHDKTQRDICQQNTRGSPVAERCHLSAFLKAMTPAVRSPPATAATGDDTVSARVLPLQQPAVDEMRRSGRGTQMQVGKQDQNFTANTDDNYSDPGSCAKVSKTMIRKSGYKSIVDAFIQSESSTKAKPQMHDRTVTCNHEQTQPHIICKQKTKECRKRKRDPSPVSRDDRCKKIRTEEDTQIRQWHDSQAVCHIIKFYRDLETYPYVVRGRHKYVNRKIVHKFYEDLWMEPKWIRFAKLKDSFSRVKKQRHELLKKAAVIDNALAKDPESSFILEMRNALQTGIMSSMDASSTEAVMLATRQLETILAFTDATYEECVRTRMIESCENQIGVPKTISASDKAVRIPVPKFEPDAMPEPAMAIESDVLYNQHKKVLNETLTFSDPEESIAQPSRESRRPVGNVNDDVEYFRAKLEDLRQSIIRAPQRKQYDTRRLYLALITIFALAQDLPDEYMTDGHKRGCLLLRERMIRAREFFHHRTSGKEMSRDIKMKLKKDLKGLGVFKAQEYRDYRMLDDIAGIVSKHLDEVERTAM